MDKNKFQTDKTNYELPQEWKNPTAVLVFVIVHRIVLYHKQISGPSPFHILSALQNFYGFRLQNVSPLIQTWPAQLKKSLSLEHIS